jgi:hypothetical protein
VSASRRRRAVATSSEMLVLRDALGFRRRLKTRPRDAEKRAVLLDLAIRKIEKAELDNFTIIGARRRHVRSH